MREGIGWRIGLFMRRLTSCDRYTLANGVLTRHHGWFRAEHLPIAEIRSWQTHPEMTFDIVILELANGDRRQWLDFDNDLLAILRQQLPQLECTP